MDTRDKIVPLDQVVAAPVLWVRGFFDPLLAEHARRLAALARPGQRLAVLIADPPRPLLPAAARAELVAALESVDYVVLENGAASVAVIDLADAGVTEELIARVLRRQV